MRLGRLKRRRRRSSRNLRRILEFADGDGTAKGAGAGEATDPPFAAGDMAFAGGERSEANYPGSPYRTRRVGSAESTAECDSAGSSAGAVAAPDELTAVGVVAFVTSEA
jgi:hypothetical protein